MLHILLLILKIIGLIILILLGLLLLAAAFLIFSPLCYRVRLSAGETLESLEGEAGFHWLFHLFSGEFFFENGDFRWHFRAGWKRFGSERNETGGSDTEKRSKLTGAEAVRERKSIGTDNLKAAKSTGSDSTKEEKRREENRKPPAAEITASKPDGEDTKTENIQKEKAASGKQNAEKAVKVSEKPKKSSEKDETLVGRIKKWVEKIKYTFRKICDKIKSLDRKRERLDVFITNEIHKKAFSRLLREIRRFFRFLRPSRLEADITFGCKDPAYTGYILAWLSMVYPMIGEYTDIHPDFERRVFRGRIYAEGKFRILYAFIFVWNMLLDKNVRTTFGHIRKFRL